MKMCENPGILRTVSFIFTIIRILGIIVPIGLIIMMAIDISKIVLNPDAKVSNQTVKTTTNRMIAAIAFFFVPTFVLAIFQRLNFDYTKSSCITDATETGIKAAQIIHDNHQRRIKEDKEAEKERVEEERLAIAEERETKRQEVYENAERERQRVQAEQDQRARQLATTRTQEFAVMRQEQSAVQNQTSNLAQTASKKVGRAVAAIKREQTNIANDSSKPKDEREKAKEIADSIEPNLIEEAVAEELKTQSPEELEALNEELAQATTEETINKFFDSKKEFEKVSQRAKDASVGTTTLDGEEAYKKVMTFRFKEVIRSLFSTSKRCPSLSPLPKLRDTDDSRVQIIDANSFYKFDIRKTPMYKPPSNLAEHKNRTMDNRIYALERSIEIIISAKKYGMSSARAQEKIDAIIEGSRISGSLYNLYYNISAAYFTKSATVLRAPAIVFWEGHDNQGEVAIIERINFNKEIALSYYSRGGGRTEGRHSSGDYIPSFITIPEGNLSNYQGRGCVLGIVYILE